MKALYFEEHGDLSVIKYGDVAEPAAGADDVIVRVRACALNHLDIWVRRGWPGLKLDLPHWCGADIAGEVVEVGRNVTGWHPGQAVIIDPGISLAADEYTRRGEDSLSPAYHVIGEHTRGGAAEYLAVPAANLAAKPAGLDFSAAAAPLLVSLTTWRMLIHRARLRAGETVLVVGSGGGVNSMAIQIAKLAGARVFAVAGNRMKAERALELGADVVLDRSVVDWSREIYRLTDKRGVDVVVDNVGQATLNQSLLAVARGGRIVIVGNTSGPEAQIDIRYIFGKQISLIGSTMGSHQDFRDIVELLGSGRLQPVIDRILPLSEGRAAYGLMERGDMFGKIVLTP
ncbi:MAG: zinc-binding dehydrogenase [Deltaproteobacteria bacterium]|nr:zinc-binding dehydrogenase [Deltaproteobacteria bacterium]